VRDAPLVDTQSGWEVVVEGRDLGALSNCVTIIWLQEPGLFGKKIELFTYRGCDSPVIAWKTGVLEVTLPPMVPIRSSKVPAGVSVRFLFQSHPPDGRNDKTG
jgi:hypothetical protein